MGTPEIFLEYKKGPKHRKLMRVKPDSDLFIIGSSRDADLRINGEGVTGCHAALRYRAPHWYLCNISGTQTVAVNGQSVTEMKLDERSAIEIAGHRLELFTKERQENIFNEGEMTGSLTRHQVVVRVKGKILESYLLGATESFNYDDGERKTVLVPPTTGRWTKTEIGARTIQQRLTSTQEIVAGEGITFDRDLRKPLLSALALLLFIMGSILVFLPKSNEKMTQLDQKSTDMIFNAKAIKKKRMEAEKVVRSGRAKAGGTNENAPSQNLAKVAPDESTAPKISEKATAALTSLRRSGLSALVGKIAKRANKQGLLVAAIGVSPDNPNAGRAFYSTGTSTVGGGGSASKEGASYRLGGVATKGKAGGSGSFKDGTSLIGTSVGTGNVVAMLDEETVIEGGLDRDAIAEVIRRNLGQIRYCYERQLSSNPDLYGKVMVKFTIGAAGQVGDPRVDNTTLKSSMVEGCILRRMASWKFPEPKGGTLVHVSYPFLFKALD
jgi:hypothetical protein